MKSMKAAALIILLGLPGASVFSAQPAFECAKSEHEIEELICQNEELAALDRTMDQVYRKAMHGFTAEDGKHQKAVQRGWIKGRNDCWKASDKVACTKFSYEIRITELQAMSGQVVVPGAVQYQCDGGKYDYITAVFYNTTQMPAVVLTRVNGKTDDQDIAYIKHTGSGAKYIGNNTVFWAKGKEAMGSWSGKDFKCKEL